METEKKCAVGHGIREKKVNADGTVTFICLLCHLSVTLEPEEGVNTSRQNWDMEVRANLFFQEHM